MTPDMNTKIQLWRQRAREGTLTQEELKEAIHALREDRVKSAKTSATSRAKKAPVNSDDLLGELDSI